ncbi:hypothetical protein [Prescottella equi]|uniref:hypothetical protein n=1 Tax=Rhodococcus hoagii TaxID=43767 RepID=UPI00111BEAEF|nr:hypothetical protein [Prescottella equi]
MEDVEFMAVTASMVRQLGSANAALVWARIQFVCQVAGPDRFEDETGRWWIVAAPRLAEDVGLSESAVRRALDSMLSSGDLEVSMRDESSWNRAKAYRVTDRISPARAHLTKSSDASDENGRCISRIRQIDLTNSSDVPIGEEVKNMGTVENDRDDVRKLCETLRDRMVENGCRKPSITTRWKTSARLLLDKDGVSLDEALAVLEWSQASDFWKANIQSIPKLRDKYDNLRLQMARDGMRLPATSGGVADWLRGCWQEFDTKTVSERSGLTFQPPDPPDGVDIREFNLQARRTWITDNRDEIIRQVLAKEARTA